MADEKNRGAAVGQAKREVSAEAEQPV